MTSIAVNPASGIQSSFTGAADDYERRMGFVTRTTAKEIASELSSLPKTAVVCDNACGTGAITDAVLEAHPTVHVEATDISQSMIDSMQELIHYRHWESKVHATRMDSVHLTFADSYFDANIMNFAIWFTSDEQKAIDEIARTLKPYGKAVVTCWKDSVLGPLFQDVQDSIKPEHPNEGLSKFSKWRDPDTLSSLFRRAGLRNINMQEFPVIQKAPSIHELAVPLAENLKVIAGSQWSNEEKAKIPVATERILRDEREKYLVVDDERVKGVMWVPWIGTAQK